MHNNYLNHKVAVRLIMQYQNISYNKHQANLKCFKVMLSNWAS